MNPIRMKILSSSEEAFLKLVHAVVIILKRFLILKDLSQFQSSLSMEKGLSSAFAELVATGVGIEEVDAIEGSVGSVNELVVVAVRMQYLRLKV